MDYDKAKIIQEIERYKKDINIHDLPSIYHYWSNKYLRPKFLELGFTDPEDFYFKLIKKASLTFKKLTIISIGSGNCDIEIRLAEKLVHSNIDFKFECLEINGHMLKRGKDLAKKKRLEKHFKFIESNIVDWTPRHRYAVVIANHSLHHFVELEVLFKKIYDNLEEQGYFLTCDMIGRNGHMRWPEALEMVHAFWKCLDREHTYNHQLKRYEELYENWDCSKEGFEGIRAQDILPLLTDKFKFEFFLGFSNVINVFVDRGFGHNFDPNNVTDRAFIDTVAIVDDHLIESGRIKPTQMIAAMSRKQLEPIRIYKWLTPEFCIRRPRPNTLWRQAIKKFIPKLARGPLAADF